MKSKHTDLKKLAENTPDPTKQDTELQQHTDSVPKKKRGRPVGWRKDKSKIKSNPTDISVNKSIDKESSINSDNKELNKYDNREQEIESSVSQTNNSDINFNPDKSIPDNTETPIGKHEFSVEQGSNKSEESVILPEYVDKLARKISDGVYTIVSSYFSYIEYLNKKNEITISLCKNEQGDTSKYNSPAITSSDSDNALLENKCNLNVNDKGKNAVEEQISIISENGLFKSFDSFLRKAVVKELNYDNASSNLMYLYRLSVGSAVINGSDTDGAGFTIRDFASHIKYMSLSDDKTTPIAFFSRSKQSDFNYDIRTSTNKINARKMYGVYVNQEMADKDCPLFIFYDIINYIFVEDGFSAIVDLDLSISDYEREAAEPVADGISSSLVSPKSKRMVIAPIGFTTQYWDASISPEYKDKEIKVCSYCNTPILSDIFSIRGFINYTEKGKIIPNLFTGISLGKCSLSFTDKDWDCYDVSMDNEALSDKDDMSETSDNSNYIDLGDGGRRFGVHQGYDENEQYY